MRRSVMAVIILLSLVTLPVSAAGRGEITIEVPSVAPAGASRSVSVCITTVVDNRTFEDRPAEAHTPSVATGGAAGLTPLERAVIIGRVRDGYGKARNNIFSRSEQPVDGIVREAVANQLTAMGYTVVTDPNTANVTMEVSIDQLWGFILVQGGGWSGSMPKMAGEISATITTRGPGERSGRFKASGTATHGFGLMTGKHWSLMFSELLSSFMTDLGKIEF